MRKEHLAWFVLAALVAGCSPPESGKAGQGTGSGKGAKGLVVGIVFDSGGRGDKSFNDSAWAGIERASKELGVTAKPVDSRTETDYENNIRTMAEGGANVVFAVGFAQQRAVEAVAPQHPGVKFAIVDAVVEAPNVRSLVFAEEQGSYLAGYLAALVSKTGKLGFVGGKTGPLIKKFEAGYTAGAKAADPDIQVLPPKYTESWDDVSLGKQAANVLFDGGADIVYHAAGRCGRGVIDAAKDKGKYAIGVDSDQDHLAPGRVLTSMIKRVDEAVYQTIEDVQTGKFTPGVKRYDLKSKGVGLSEMKFTKDKISPDILKKVEEASAKIASGEIKVPAE